MQLSTQIKLDLMADEAAKIMSKQSEASSTKEKTKTKHSQSQYAMEKNKNKNAHTNGVSLDSMIMERVEAESTAVAR